MDHSLEEFAAAVGVSDPVAVVGSGSRGGGPDGVRTVSAPAGIARIDAAEMVIECGAATLVDEVLDALAALGQTVSVPSGGTIGGALAAGQSDITRLGHGPLRDVLLQTHFVAASGKLTKAGGPTVKNVSGFDLCRLLVGARGTIGFFGDVILRTRPLARTSNWFVSDADPFMLLADLYRPVSMLWDGVSTWVRLDGEAGDVATAAQRHGLVTVDRPPEPPSTHRTSMPPSALVSLADQPAGSFLAEVGVGIVHHHAPLSLDPSRIPGATAIADLHRRIKEQFDPTGRMNPGIDPLGS